MLYEVVFSGDNVIPNSNIPSYAIPFHIGVCGLIIAWALGVEAAKFITEAVITLIGAPIHFALWTFDAAIDAVYLNGYEYDHPVDVNERAAFAVASGHSGFAHRPSSHISGWRGY